jgi:hypothetical protein
MTTVVAQGDSFSGSRLVVGLFLVSRKHQILVAIIVQIGESEAASPPVGLGEGGVDGEAAGATEGELVRLERTARVA